MIRSIFGSEVGVGIILLVLVFGVTGLVRGCASFGAPDDYHYRMTIYVGDKAFSDVRHVTFDSDLSPETFKPQHTYRVDGKAIPITLSGRPVFFAVRRYSEFSPEYVAILPDARRLNPSKKQITSSDISRVKGERDLPRQLLRSELSDSSYHQEDVIQNWPEFVAFGDMKDPKTKRIVTAEKIGVTRITIEIIDAPEEEETDDPYPELKSGLQAVN